MAKCDLSIELDEPQAVHPGGGTITGTVRVHADADVTCNGLDVSSGWKTHGRGNVASETVHTATLFTGEWRNGETNEYRFELPIGDWPPSYHGNFLNVDHYVDARARIPWAFDPKASAPFFVRPTCGPEGVVSHSNATQISGVAGCIIGAFVFAFVGVFVIGMGAALLAEPWVLLFILFIPAIGGGIWFVKAVLPKLLLGDVVCELDHDQLAPGQPVRGRLVFTPRRNVPVNAITLQLLGTERVVSGSGSNRRTHTHEFHDDTQTLQPATTLPAGKLHEFRLDVSLPAEAPYSIDLDDNDLVWNAKVRIDIPRWPDWTRDLQIGVVPAAGHVDDHGPTDAAAAESSKSAFRSTGEPDDAPPTITFDETVTHLWNVRNDTSQATRLVEAVDGLSFDVDAEIERRLLYIGDDAPIGRRDGHAVWARYPDPPLPLVLFIPKHLGDEFEQTGRQWSGRATVAGWDSQHRRLQLIVEP